MVVVNARNLNLETQVGAIGRSGLKLNDKGLGIGQEIAIHTDSIGIVLSTWRKVAHCERLLACKAEIGNHLLGCGVHAEVVVAQCYEVVYVCLSTLAKVRQALLAHNIHEVCHTGR